MYLEIKRLVISKLKLPTRYSGTDCMFIGELGISIDNSINSDKALLVYENVEPGLGLQTN